MGKRRRRSNRRSIWPVVAVLALAAVVAAGVGYMLFRPTTDYSAAARDYTPAPFPTQSSEPLDVVTIAEGTRTVIMGDSWTGGYGADDPKTEGWATVLGETLALDYSTAFVSGTGYMNAGNSGQDTYLQRLERTSPDGSVQLLIIQGSGNDAGTERPVLRARVLDTFAQARITYPNASLVAIGPAPLKFPLKGDIPVMDSVINATAKKSLARYISPYRGEWFNEQNAASMIDPDKFYHPTTEGHRMFAEKVAEQLRELAG